MTKYLAVLLIFSCIHAMTGQIDSGLVAKYTFNHATGKNEKGSQHAVLHGGDFTDDRFGNRRSAYYISGNPTDYISLGTSNVLKPAKGTISIWVNIRQAVYSGYGVDQNPILMTRSHGGQDCNEAFFLGYHLTLRTFNANTTLDEKKQVIVCPDDRVAYFRTWYHLVLTYDDNFLCFYVDGVLQGKTPKGFRSRFLEGDSVVLGNRTSPRNNRYFMGYVDDILIYDRVLSPDEVMKLFNAPNPNKYKALVNWLLIGLGVLIFIFLVIWYIRYRIRKILEAEKEKNELRNRWYEQENRVLSAQMDPHFIFNSLNAIQQFIITNDNEKAQLYLSKFSRLMRKLLESNTRESVTLQEEIEILEKYLEIESLRFNNVFKYNITLDGKIDPEGIQIPHFLIQPLIENAVWHGLLPKEGDKQLSVVFAKEPGLLCCTIKDNGVGRKKTKRSAEEEKKSLAINFIEQRLALLSKLHNVKCNITIVDDVDALNRSLGTTVIIKIPILNTR